MLVLLLVVMLLVVLLLLVRLKLEVELKVEVVARVIDQFPPRCAEHGATGRVLYIVIQDCE